MPEGKLEQLQKLPSAASHRMGQPDGCPAIGADRTSIDTAQIWFQTKKRQYVIIDVPGHKGVLKT